jgi:hypothetical protein
MKKAFLLLAMCLLGMSANAQITTGKTTSKVVRTGNRAQQGNYGLYLGATTDMFKNIGDGNVKFSALPLINAKYMYTDNTELRLGLEWWKKSETFDAGQEAEQWEKSYMLYPGIAYHFNNKNLLDVYVGGELPIGFGSKGVDDGNQDSSASQFRIGLGGFIGLQAYIANLPLALGVEYGISMLSNSVSDGTITQDGMTIERIQEDLDVSRFQLGHQARFTLTYYFDL